MTHFLQWWRKLKDNGKVFSDFTLLTQWFLLMSLINQYSLPLIQTESRIIVEISISLSETSRGWKFGPTPLKSLRSKAHKVIREILPYIWARYAFKLGHSFHFMSLWSETRKRRQSKFSASTSLTETRSVLRRLYWASFSGSAAGDPIAIPTLYSLTVQILK